MLQQTTVKAVVPYFNRFLERFPDIQSLASARPEDVLKYWAGLGYYSRARNLHKAAQEISKCDEFPRSYSQLLEMPGFGPYTARAVASLAFDEPVGVLDGNVIRVLSRWRDEACEWWRPAERQRLQEAVDQWVQGVASSEMNQALMELGATVCTPQNPKCILCPLLNSCHSRRSGRAADLPLSKPRNAKVQLLWNLQLQRQTANRWAIVNNTYAPFLKGHWIFPGAVKVVTRAPKKFDFKHSITKYEIFVKVSEEKSENKSVMKSRRWRTREQILAECPSSVMAKVFATLEQKKVKNSWR